MAELIQLPGNNHFRTITRVTRLFSVVETRSVGGSTTKAYVITRSGSKTWKVESVESAVQRAVRMQKYIDAK